MLPAEWQMPLAVLGLLVGLLFAASVVSKYQAYKAQQRATVKRIGTAIPIIEDALAGLHGVPLSQSLRTVLRNDVYQRYLAIGQTVSSYPNLSALLSQSKARLESEPASQGASVGPVEDEQQRAKWLSAVGGLLAYLERGGPITHLRTDDRLLLMQELKERRAEINARFYIVQSHRAEEAGDKAQARKLLSSLMRMLKEQGPNTDFVRALYAEVETLYAAVGASTEPEGSNEDAAVGTTSSA